MVVVSEKDVLQILEKLSIDVTCYESHEVLPISDKPIGYLADHFFLQVNFTSDPLSKKFFLKCCPRNVEKRQEYLKETGFFKREVQLFCEIIPKLLKFSSVSWAPECYLAKEGHFIVLEILDDYKINSSKNLTFDFDHLKVAAKTLATFHASSLILESKTGVDLSKKYEKMLEENAYPLIEGHIRQRGFENAITVLTELIKLIPKYKNSTRLEEILKRFPDTMRKIYEYAKPSQKYKNVVSHGDLWVNNVMFKYENGKPVGCKFVDFQLSRIGPPAFDLAELIYINSTKDFRKDNLDNILNIYCKSFEEELRTAGVNTSILSQSEILESIKDFHLVGLIEAACFDHLTLLPSTLSSSIMSSSDEYDKFINQSRVAVCLKAFEEDYYRERMTDILSEIVDTFILKTDS